MKTRFFASLAALAVVLILPLASYGQTVTTLLSQTFASTQAWPPAGWTFSTTAASSPDAYGTQTAWYPSTGGNGGSGGTYGSAVAYTNGAYNYVLYNTDNVGGYYCGPISMTTPTVNFSSFPSNDSQFVDFDIFYPESYYMQYYTAMKTSVTVSSSASATPLLTLKGGGGSQGNCTFYVENFPPYGTDPSNYSSSSYWAHYHLALPRGVSSQSINFLVQQIGPATYSYWYTDNVAITNIKITDVDYKYLTVLGPTTMNFGTVPVTLSAGPYYTRLANPNTSSITLSNYALIGTDPGDFTITRMPTTIPPGGEDSIGIVYSPLAPGGRSAYLTFNSNASPAMVTDTLIGQGVVPDVSYSSNILFQGVNIELTDTSRVQYLYVNSTGGVPLVINSVSFYGLNAGDYYISHKPAGPIAVGSVDSIGVRFIPSVEGLPDAHMVVNSNAGNIPSDTLMMYGVGILPHLSIDSGKSWPLPTTVNFDSVKLGSDSMINVELTNPGSDTVAIEKNFFVSNDPDFTIVPITGSDTLIPPGGEQNIQITFTPVQQGTRIATIRILTDIPHTETTPPQDTSEFVVNIIGIGLPNGKLSVTGPAQTDSVLLGKSACQTDTLWNTGEAAIQVTGVAISGANASNFTPSGLTFPFTLAANSSMTFPVCADLTDTGEATALLTASGTSGESPIFSTLSLGAYGELIADTAIVRQPFASESCGADTMLVTVTNTGNVPESYTGSVPLNANFTLIGSGSTPATPAGGVDTFKILFTPTTSGTVNGQLNIVGGSGPIPITFSASAGAATIAGTQAAPMTSIGQTSPQFTVTVNNTGSCPWTSGTPAVDSQFTYVSGAGTIAAGGSSPFVFTYTPTVAGGATYPVTFPSATGATTAAPNVTITTALDGVAQGAVSDGFSLEQNYPNPFNQTSSIEITLPVPSLVHLSIVDVEGQVVETLLNQHYDAGSFEVSLDATGLASGTYYYQMTAGDVTLTRQMVVIK